MYTPTIIAAFVFAPPTATDPPAKPQLEISIDLASLAESPLFRKDAAGWRAWSDDWTKALKACGVAPDQIGTIRFVAGEDFPRGSVIALTGMLDAKMAEERLRRQAADRQTGTRRVNDEPWQYSVEIPFAANPIPGLPTTAFIAAGNANELIVTFEKGTARPNESHGPKPNGAALTATLSPPTSTIGPGGLFAGINRLTAEVKVSEGLSGRVTATPTDSVQAVALAQRVRQFVEQVRRNFPPLAAQQGVSPRLITFVGDLFNAARVELRDGRVDVDIEIPGEVILKLIAK